MDVLIVAIPTIMTLNNINHNNKFNKNYIKKKFNGGSKLNKKKINKKKVPASKDTKSKDTKSKDTKSKDTKSKDAKSKDAKSKDDISVSSISSPTTDVSSIASPTVTSTASSPVLTTDTVSNNESTKGLPLKITIKDSRNKSKLKNLLSATPSSIKAKNIVAMIAVHSVSSLVIYNLLSRFF